MKKSVFVFVLLLMATISMANISISEVLAEYAWDKRQLIVFTPDKENEDFIRFLKNVKQSQQMIKERNLHTWFVIDDSQVFLDSVKRDDIKNHILRNAYKVNKNEFRILLLGYDLGEKLRLEKSNLDIIFSEIDQMPMRIQEMKK